MAAKALVVLCVLAAASQVDAVKTTTASSGNPIRKVVTLLQKMQQEVTAEGEKEEDNFNKFMCYCKNGKGALSDSIEAAKTKIAALSSAVKEDLAKKEQTEADLKEHKASRTEAKAAMAAATALREKQEVDFKKESTDLSTNLAALKKAVSAIENGMGGSFLQTGAAALVKKFTMEKATLPDMSRQEVLAFLSGTQDQSYAPSSGEISGILQTMSDEMQKSLDDATKEENSAIAQNEEIIAAKKKEVGLLTKQIEAELTRLGALGVRLATVEKDIADSKESLAGDEKFLSQLEEGCDSKAKEWEVIKATRSEEVVAIAETIKVLNDDDALELFKKTLPSASASFMQVQVGASTMKARALSAVRSALVAQHRTRGHKGALRAHPKLNLIALALTGKQAGMEKVIGMIDNMVGILKSEQEDDDVKKAYCEKEFDASEDKTKVLQNSIKDSEAAMKDMEGSIDVLAKEIAELEAGIKALDKSVSEATGLRKSENSEHKELMAADGTAKEVLLWAKNRLAKFYNPKMYKAPPAAELSAEDSIYTAEGGTLDAAPVGGIAGTGIGAAFVQVRAVSQVDPGPAPETFGSYKKKGGAKNGVVAMIDILVADLDKEMQEADVSEKDAQKEYEATMVEAAAKRAEDAKSIADKAASKASEEETLEAESIQKDGSSKDLMATLQYISTLHGDCDWLVKYYGARQTARNDEIESLGRAKAALSGADYSLVQTGVRRHLRLHK